MAKKPRPSVPVRVQKILYALSGNQCAHPDCETHLVQRTTVDSDAAVIGELCHIHSVSSTGPRSAPTLPVDELNSEANLILLCPTHHALVDNQPDVYTADVLRKWKRQHQSERLSPGLPPVTQPPASPGPYPTALIDQHVDADLSVLRKRRFFPGFDTVRFALTFATQLTTGDYSAATSPARARALAWCARLLSHGDQLPAAEGHLRSSLALVTCPENRIARAFVASGRSGNKSDALGILAGLDSPMSRTAAFLIVLHHDGTEQAIRWLRAAAIQPAAMDAEGRCFLLARCLQVADWSQAQRLLTHVSDQDLSDTPYLHQLKALTCLATVVPEELRTTALNALPFAARDFPLAGGDAAMRARRAAQDHFRAAATAAREADCELLAKAADEYSLWLTLRDPDHTDSAQKKLEALLRQQPPDLRFVHLGLQFGLHLDIPAIQKAIARESALHGGITVDAALARFSLAFTQPDQVGVANYVSRHFDELSKHIAPKAMRLVQIEALAKAKQTQRAYDLLAMGEADGLTDLEESRLRRIIAEAEGVDPGQSRKEHYEKTHALADLVHLVDELERQRDWVALCHYGDLLFKKTKTLNEATRLATALHNNGKCRRLLTFLSANDALLSRSDTLRLLYAWALYGNGALLDARSAMSRVNRTDDRNYRDLQLRVALGLGDWHQLSVFVANEWHKRRDRSAEELMAAAELAVHLGLPSARELTVAATEREEADAAVFAAAYFLATRDGWEHEPVAAGWLRQAVERSGREGPLQAVALKELVERKPEWDRHEEETWEQLRRASMPMFVAGRSINRSLVGMTLVPALRNTAQLDPRRRATIPAYSGFRGKRPLTADRTIGLDATALLTLEWLEALSPTLATFDAVHLPHTTLSWLLQERGEVVYHQPSRVRAARRLQELVGNAKVRSYTRRSTPPTELTAEIGDEMATFLSDAIQPHDGTEQRLVVRCGPVYRTATLMKEAADLGKYAPVLSSCRAVVDKLRALGHLTASEVDRARRYLRLQEEPWAGQPAVTEGAILYLEELSVGHLLHLGLLERLSTAGFKVFVSEAQVSEAASFLSYEATAASVVRILDSMRSTLNQGLESAKIRLGQQGEVDQTSGNPLAGHPSLGIADLVAVCDAIVVDDRFFNGRAAIAAGDAEVQVFTTLDVLDLLVASGAWSAKRRTESLTRLRRAGYCFVPIRRDELLEGLRESVVENGDVVETAELRAIRESLGTGRMSAFLQWPFEGAWLDDALRTLLEVLKDVWLEPILAARARALSNWLVREMDVRRWAHCVGTRAQEVATGGWAWQLASLAFAPASAPDSVREEYLRWFEEEQLQTVKERHPEVYGLVVRRVKQMIGEVATAAVTGGLDGDG